MNNNYNFGFVPNPSFMRNMPNVMPMMRMGAPVRMMPRASLAGIPRISSLFSGARLGGAGAGAVNAASGASKLTFTSILSGASKTLGVINQAIPVFYQVKPIWNNARTMFRVVREINSDNPRNSSSYNNTVRNNQNISNNDSNKNVSEAIFDEKKQKKEEDNSPTFFV